MTDDFEPTKIFRLVEKKTPTTFHKDMWYISSRDGRVEKVKCVRGGRADAKAEPPVFLPSGAHMAFEIKQFDWLLADPG